MNKGKQYDFFISHASEDKEEFVRPLANKLVSLGYKVWYDEFTLKIGDSLVSMISEGIKNSLYGIVVLSENFINKEWTKIELNSILNKETFAKSDILLPVWYKINQESVYNYSPLLVDKIAVKANSKFDINKIVNSIFKKVKLNIVSKDHISQKVDYIKGLSKEKRAKYYLEMCFKIQ